MIDAIDPALVALLGELALANGEAERDELERQIRLWERRPSAADNEAEGAS